MPHEIGQLPPRIIDSPNLSPLSPSFRACVFPFPIRPCQMTSESRVALPLSRLAKKKKKKKNKIGRPTGRSFSKISRALSAGDPRRRWSPTGWQRVGKLADRSSGVTVARWIIEHVRGTFGFDGRLCYYCHSGLPPEASAAVNPFVIARTAHRTVLMRCSALEPVLPALENGIFNPPQFRIIPFCCLLLFVFFFFLSLVSLLLDAADIFGCWRFGNYARLTGAGVVPRHSVKLVGHQRRGA